MGTGTSTTVPELFVLHLVSDDTRTLFHTLKKHPNDLVFLQEGGESCSRRHGEDGQCERLEWEQADGCNLTLKSASKTDVGMWTATILGQDYNLPPKVCQVLLEIARPASVNIGPLASSIRAGKVSSVECQADEGGLPLPVLEAYLEGEGGEGRRALEAQEDPVPGDRSRSFTLVSACFKQKIC